MHEMTVTQGLLNMALDHAQGQRVTDIYLQVGKLAPIVPDSVELFFDYLSKGTRAEGAKLHFEITPVEMTCQACGRKADTSPWATEPPHIIMANALAQGCVCGSKNLRITGGVSFGMTSITVDDQATDRHAPGAGEH